MPVSVTYSTTGGGSTERCRVVLTDILPGEVITFDWESPATGATHTYTVSGTDETAEYGLLETNLDAFIVSQGADSFWEYVNTTNGTIYIDLLYPTFVGRIAVTSDNGGSMTTKIWRGDAPAVAQVVHVQASSVNIGDTFTLTINGKSITVTATAASATNVATLFEAAIQASDITEFQELDVSVDSDILILTASEAGKPFEISGSDTNGSTMGVSIETSVSGVAAANQTEVFRVPLSAAGTFTIVIGDQITSALAVGAAAATVQTAVQALSTIGSGNCTVTKATDSNDDIYTLTFVGSLAGKVVATAIVTLTSTKPTIRTTQAGQTYGTLVRNEIQTVDTGQGTGGATFTLTLDGQTTGTLTAASTAADMKAALEALSNVETVNVTKSGTLFTVEFTGVDGSADQPQMTASVYSSGVTAVFDLAVTVTAPVAGVNEQQLITLTGNPNGGTFTLTFSGQTTAGIAYNASAATVQTALQALSSIGSGNATVTGSAGGPWTVTFGGTLAATNVAQMTASGASLTGGSAEALSVSTFVASSGPNHWDCAANWLPSGVPVNGDAVRFELGSVDCLYGLNQSTVTLASLRVSMAYTGKIGLPRLNPDGYFEYRMPELSVGSTAILIGHGEGSGPGKVALNTGSVQTTLEVRGSGSSSETGVPAVTWRGTHASNSVTILDGEFGTAPYSDQSAVINTLTQRGGSVALKHTALSELIAAKQSISAHDCTLGGQPLEL